MTRLAMVRITAVLLVCLASSARATAPTHLWSRSWGNTYSEVGVSIAVDLAGNVLVAGSFNGTVNLGGADLVSAGSADFFIARYSPSGTHLWSQRFGGTTAEVVSAIALDADGNLLVTGIFEGTVDFGGGDLVSAGEADVFIARFGRLGEHHWSRRVGGAEDDRAASIAVDKYNYVIITGYFEGTADFGGGPLLSVGSYDICLAEYAADGSHVWSRRFGAYTFDEGHAVAVDDSRHVILLGTFVGHVDFGGGTLVSAGNDGLPDIVLAKYSYLGTHRWSQRFGGPASDHAGDVAVDASRNIVVTGGFRDAIDLGGGALGSVGDSDIFLAKFGSLGTHQWSQSFGDSLLDSGSSVAVDDDGVLLSGYFNTTIDLGGDDLVSAGSGDICIAAFDADGAHRWSQRYGGISLDAAGAMATNGRGSVFATGYFFSVTDFGGGPLVSAGMEDGFVAAVGVDTGLRISSISDVGNDQGRRVSIRFPASDYDGPASPAPIAQYEAYRRNDVPAGSLPGYRDPSGHPARELLADGWTQVGVVAAHGESAYYLDAPTNGDSTLASGPYDSAFFIRAASSDPLVYFDSPVDSGYSLDNLSPGVPVNLAYAAGSLSWDESPAADFDFFTVYGSNTDSFGTATVVDYSVAPAMDVTSSPYVFYFVTATDFSGNEGKPAKVNTLSGVGGTPRSYVLSVSNFPNPFNPRTTVSYTVPSRGHVTVAVYDARGALVATLFNGERTAGAYSIEWDGRAQGGATVSTGVYFARIEHASGTRSKKMVLLK